jgi:endonuclease/exonuclease/phosphatase (EEP) superfamily protein YafD
MLLAGDFNTFSPGYLKAIHSVLAKLSLEYVPIKSDPRPRTQALDQVFCRGLDVHAIEVDTTIKNSDHFPIFLTISCKK